MVSKILVGVDLMVSIILCCARVFRSLSRTCSLQLALPVPFHIFSVLLLLVNTTSLLNPTSLAFMTASTMTSWPTKGWNMHSSYCNLQRAWLLLHFWPQKEYPLLLYFLFLILVVLMRSCLPLSFPHCFLCSIPWTSHYKLFHNWMEECSNPM